MDTKILSTTVPEGVKGEQYQFCIDVENLDLNYEYDITSGRLPKGMRLFENTVITGTPEESGVFHFTLSIKDQNGELVDEQKFLLTIKVPSKKNAKQPDPLNANSPDPVTPDPANPDDEEKEAPKKGKFPKWAWALIVIAFLAGITWWIISAATKSNTTVVNPTPIVETEVPTDIVETEVPTDIVETEAPTDIVETEAPIIATLEPTLMPTSVFANWIYDPAANTLTLDGIADGKQDVALTSDVTDPETLNLVRGGTTAIWTTSVPGQVIFCVGDLYVDDILVGSKTNCDGVKIPVAAGTVKLVNSTGPIGGMRWQPAIDGYMTGNIDPCVVDGSCWQLAADETSYSWTGPVDGTTDIHQAARADVLTWVRNGGVVDLTTTVPMQIIGTCHIKIEVLDENDKVLYVYERHDCGLIDQAVKIPAGHIRLSASTGDSGGWRLSPWFGFGWRAQEAMPSEYDYIDITDFPAG